MSDRTSSPLVESLSPDSRCCYPGSLLSDPVPSSPEQGRLERVAIMAIGGAEDKIQDRLILRTFVQLSGGERARIMVIPLASGDPATKGEIYAGLFQGLGAQSTQILLGGDRSEAASPVWVERLRQCTSVFISGGDQSRLCELLADTPVIHQLRQEVCRGRIVLAGTSAGAAVIGHHMITGGGSGEAPHPGLVDLDKGFGILPGAIVDQHFHNRNRLARLISAVATYPHTMGIGIDEDTCALVNERGEVRVIGKGAVTILQAPASEDIVEEFSGQDFPLSLYNLQLHLLRHGDCYHSPRLKAADELVSHWPARSA